MSRFVKTSVTLNGIDLAQLYGFALDPGSPSPFDIPARTTPVLAIPGAAGVILPGTAPAVGPKTLTFGGTFVAYSQSEIVATEAAIKDIAANGLVQIVFSQQSARAWYGVLQGLTVTYPSYGSLNRIARVSFSFLCPIPYAINIAQETIAFGSTAVTIPLGTAPSVGRDDWSAAIHIVGAATTPTLTYADGAGNTVGTMVFTSSPAAGDHIRIDIGRRLVKKSVSGTYSNAFGDLTAGYTWPALDPGDGSWNSSLWPSLKVSSGVGILTYFRMYR